MTTKVVTTLINPSTINNENDKCKEEIDKNETNTQRKKKKIINKYSATIIGRGITSSKITLSQITLSQITFSMK
jgi:hypothetical protein